MTSDPKVELLELNQRLLVAIASGDWAVYRELCAEDLTCFEPESRGQQVEGLTFHKFYFDLHGNSSPRNTTMASPRVRMLGVDAALLTYVRLSQSLTEHGEPQTNGFEETRVWQRIDGRWRHVHFHRSKPE